MDALAKSDAQERADLFGETAARKGIPAALIEKDFWVCWALRRLFGLEGIGAQIIFKGGTSLSKAYKVIDRFSEDIDVTINRGFLGFSGEKDPANKGLTKKGRERLLDQLTDAAFAYARQSLKPALEADFATILGNKGKGAAWDVGLTRENDGSPTLSFMYPAGTALHGLPIPEHIKASVRIEIGARGELWPSKILAITPYAAEEFPKVFSVPACDINVLEIERTFWEKATLLHAEGHRPESKPLPSRLSRHHGDLAALAVSPYRTSSLKRLDLLDAVARHKALFFRSSWAHYDDARPGTLRLSPPEHQVSPLRHDFNRTKIMFFNDPPKFEWILDQLRDLESEINRLHR